MDIKQAQIDKAKAETLICNVLNEFVQKTGLTVTELSMHTIDITGMMDNRPVHHIEAIRIEVRL